MEVEDLITNLSGSTGMSDSASLRGKKSPCSHYRDHSEREEASCSHHFITWYLLTVTKTMENMQVNGAAGQRRMHCCVKRQLKTTKIIWSRLDNTNIAVTTDSNRSENVRGVQLCSRIVLIWSDLQQK